MRRYSAAGFAAVISALPMLACKEAKGPDLSALPLDQNGWCCRSELCFASIELRDLPACTNHFLYGARHYALSEASHTIEGKKVGCVAIVREALKLDLDLLSRHRPDEFPSVLGARPAQVGGCVDSIVREARDLRAKAYVFTWVDRRSEKKEFNAYPSAYYCDKGREELGANDWAGSISNCVELPAVPVSR